MPFGLLISLESFEKNLQKLTPIETVIPSSFCISAEILCAISSPEPKSKELPVTSSQHSSILNGSTRSVYLRYICLARTENSRYLSICGGTQTSWGQIERACQTVCAVFTPAFLASWFFASTIPCLSLSLPQTAIGTSRSSGLKVHSTEAKKLSRSQCRITLSPIGVRPP